MPARRHRPLAALALVAALVALPVGVLASHDFPDVPDSNIFHADISALADSGVTTGCGGGNFCPSAFVTREQMAAFMNRLGALAPGKTPVVNAAQLGGLSADELTRMAFAENPGPSFDGDLAEFGDALTAAITAPAPGWLVVHASAEFNQDAPTNDVIQCRIRIDDTVVTGSSRNVGLGSGSRDEGCSTEGVRLVCVAGEYVVDLYVSDVGVESNVQDAILIVQYQPFDGLGSSAAGACQP